MMLLMETQPVPPAAAGQMYSQYVEEAADHQQVQQQVQQVQDDLPVQQQVQDHEDIQQHQEEEEQRVLEPLQPSLQLQPVQLLDVQHASALVSWPQATYTLPDHENDDEQVAYQLQVHYKVSYTLQVQQLALGPPTAKEPVEQLLSSVPAALLESAWKDVLTLEEAPAESQKVSSSAHSVYNARAAGIQLLCNAAPGQRYEGLGWLTRRVLTGCGMFRAVQVPSLRAGRFYAVRLRAYAYAELDTGPVFFDDTYMSEPIPFRTVPCAPGQMQAPSLARRDRTLLKVSLLAAAVASAPSQQQFVQLPLTRNRT